MNDGDDSEYSRSDEYDSDPGDSAEGSSRDWSRSRVVATKAKATRGARMTDTAHKTREGIG